MTDLIDREEALDFKVSRGLNEDGILYVPYADVKKHLEQLPTAERKGHWENEETHYLCSECYRGCWVNSAYCPWCGADMRGKQ